jgi:hypothetical protein
LTTSKFNISLFNRCKSELCQTLVFLTLICIPITQAHANDNCPTPKVLVQQSDFNDYSVTYTNTKITQLNSGSIRFFELVLPLVESHKLSGDEYTLNTTSVTDPEGFQSISVTLHDPKGRLVHSAAISEPRSEQARQDALDNYKKMYPDYNYDTWHPFDMGKYLADLAADAMTPMIESIRRHQKKIREAENTAIYPRITPNPVFAEIEIDEELEIELEMIDCDGYILSNRRITIEQSGVGEIEPMEFTTDTNGKGTIVFKSSESGTANIYSIYHFERPEGVHTIAETDIITVNVEGGHALTEGEMTTTGVISRARYYSCNGVGGSWTGFTEITFNLPEVSGSLGGNGDFTFSDEPMPGETAEATINLNGVLNMPEGVTADFKGVLNYTVVLIGDDDGNQYLGSKGGNVRGNMRVTIPGEGSINIPWSYPLEHGEPSLIQIVSDLQECEELPLAPLGP